MPNAEILEVPWQKIRPMPNQPREFFDKEALKELAGSIAAVGQLAPALVTRVAGDPRNSYELIDGQRRWHAVQLAGLPCLRVTVSSETDPERRFMLATVANFGREENHPLEIAKAVTRLRNRHSVEDIAAMLGKSDCWVYQHMALLNLHPDLQEMLHPSTPKPNRIPFMVGVKLAGLPREDQLDMLSKLRGSDLSMTAAARAILPVEARTSRVMPREDGEPHGAKFNNWHSLNQVLGRLAAILKALPVERFKNIVRARNGDDLPGMRDVLQGIRDTLDSMITTITEEERTLPPDERQ